MLESAVVEGHDRNALLQGMALSDAAVGLMRGTTPRSAWVTFAGPAAEAELRRCGWLDARARADWDADADRLRMRVEAGAQYRMGKVRVAGVVLTRQRPGKGNAVFITIEDETGIVNALLWARDMEKQRRAVMAARLMLIEGAIQKSAEGVVHLMASTIIDRTAMLNRLTDQDRITPPLSRSDEVTHPQHPRNVRILPQSRDFH